MVGIEVLSFYGAPDCEIRGLVELLDEMMFLRELPMMF
jgi:hypothetical protein